MFSHYTANDIPSAEIDRVISWHQHIKHEADYAISQLRAIKKERERAQQWRNKMNDIARQFMDEDALDLDLDMRADIIFQRLDVDRDRARHIAEIVHRWAKAKALEKRNARIKADRKAGMSAKEIAAKYNISRQQVYTLTKENLF